MNTHTIELILLIATGCWEVIGRIIPSVGNITIVSKLLEILQIVSNFLNNKSTKQTLQK